MKISILLLLILLFNSYRAFSQDQMVKAEEAQFGSSLNMLPYKIFFKRGGKQYSVDLPFKMSDKSIQKLLTLADVNKPRGYMEDRELEDLYQAHITNGNKDKYFDGSVKQWGQLTKSEQEKFEKNIMPKMKDYFLPLQEISFQNVMESLISGSPDKKDCNCVDLNGVQIKTCE